MLKSPVFEKAVYRLIDIEGGYVNDPDDPGGPTKYGITQATLAEFRGEPARAEDVESLTKEQAAVIYHERYWRPIGGDRLVKPSIATAMLDAAALFGVHISATRAQKAARAAGFSELAVDGHIGPFSTNALAAVDSKLWLKSFTYLLKSYIDGIIERRPTSGKYRNGWVGRIEKYEKLTDV